MADKYQVKAVPVGSPDRTVKVGVPRRTRKGAEEQAHIVERGTANKGVWVEEEGKPATKEG